MGAPEKEEAISAAHFCFVLLKFQEIQRTCCLSARFSGVQHPQRQGRSYTFLQEATTSADLINTVPERATDGLLDISQAADTTGMDARKNYR